MSWYGEHCSIVCIAAAYWVTEEVDFEGQGLDVEGQVRIYGTLHIWRFKRRIKIFTIVIQRLERILEHYYYSTLGMRQCLGSELRRRQCAWEEAKRAWTWWPIESIWRKGQVFMTSGSNSDNAIYQDRHTARECCTGRWWVWSEAAGC